MALVSGAKPGNFISYAKISQKISSNMYGRLLKGRFWLTQDQPVSGIGMMRNCMKSGGAAQRSGKVEFGMREFSMPGQLRQIVLTLLCLIFAVPFISMGSSISASAANSDAGSDMARSDVDGLLIIPAAAGDGTALSSLQARLEFAAGAALMDIGILPIDANFISVPNRDRAQSSVAGDRDRPLDLLRRLAAERSGRLLAVEFDLLTSNGAGSLPIPAASVIDVASSQLVARSSTLPILEPESDLAISAAAAALTRALARQLETHGYVLSAAARKPWGGRATQYRLALEGFDLCERRGLLATMETEFPGFLSIDLIKAPNPTFAVYLYDSTATGQRLQKWLEQLMVSYGLASSPTSRLLVKDDSIRIQKDRSTRIYSPLCDG